MWRASAASLLALARAAAQPAPLQRAPLLLGALRREASGAARAPRAARAAARAGRSRARPAASALQRAAASRVSPAQRALHHELLRAPLTVTQVLRLIATRSDSFTPLHEVSALARLARETEGMAGLNHAALEDHEAVQTLLARMKRSLLSNAYDARALSHSAYAFARLGFGAHKRSGQVWRLLAERTEQHASALDAHSISCSTWAFAIGNLAGARAQILAEVFRELASAAERRAADFTPQGLSNVAWALSLADDVRPYTRALVALARRSLESVPEKRDTKLNATRVAHSIASALLTTSLALPAHPTDEVSACVRPLLARARARYEATRVNQRIVSSRSHLDLSATLARAGWAHECEVHIEGGLLILDMACTRTRVAVEFDGPGHYARARARARARAAGGGDDADGWTPEDGVAEAYDVRTRWKSRVLSALGWAVFRVGWREWGALDNDEGAKRAYGAALVARMRASNVMFEEATSVPN